MLSAKYAYDGPYPGSLSFEACESFLRIRVENDEWVSVAKMPDAVVASFAKTAFAKLQKSDRTAPCDKDAIMKWVGYLISSLSRILCNIIDRPTNKSRAPDIPSRLAEQDQHKMEKSPFSHVEPNHFKNQKASAPGLPETLASDLVNLLRLGTMADHNTCKNTFRLMLQLLASGLPQLHAYTEALDSSLMNPNLQQKSRYCVMNPDWHLLRKYCASLRRRSSNVGEHNWNLHSDQREFNILLDSTMNLLNKADRELVTCFLNEEAYRPLIDLTDLFHREQNWSLRAKLLRCICLCCSIEPGCAHELLQSTFPEELLRVIRLPAETSDWQVVGLCLRLLINFLALPTAPPALITCLDDNLFRQILGMISEWPPLEESVLSLHLNTHPVCQGHDQSETFAQPKPVFHGRLRHLAFVFLLVANLHLRPTSSSNSLLKAIADYPLIVQSLMAMLKQVFNRGVDPVNMMNFTVPDGTKLMQCPARWVRNVCETYEKGRIDHDSIISLNEGLIFEHDAAYNAVHEAEQYDDEAYCAWLIASDNLSERVQLFFTRPTNGRGSTSVIKLLCSLLESENIVILLSESDLSFVVEIVSRKLIDSEPDSEELPPYLELLHSLVLNTAFKRIGGHKYQDILGSLHLIVTDGPSGVGQTLASAILESLGIV